MEWKFTHMTVTKLFKDLQSSVIVPNYCYNIQIYSSCMVWSSSDYYPHTGAEWLVKVSHFSALLPQNTCS